MSNISNSTEISNLINKFSPYRVASKVEVNYSKFNNKKHFDDAVYNYLNELSDLGFQRVLFKDNDIIINKKSYDLDILRELCKKSGMKITLYNGINNAEDLWKINDYFKYGIDSVVLGEPIFKNYFPCQKIWRLAEAELEI